MEEPKERKHTMDRELVSQEPHELEYLASTHGASVEEVKAVISEVGSRSRQLVEEELDKRYSHRSRSTHPKVGKTEPWTASSGGITGGGKPAGGTKRA